MRIAYLHGFASGPSSKKARFFRDRFAERGIEIAVPDLTEGDFEHLTITGQLAVVERLAPDVVIGSSMGGYLAALHAARQPRVAQIILLAPAFGFARRWPLSLGPEKVDAWRRSGWLPVYNYAAQNECRVHYGLLEDGEGYEDYPDVRQPALVFHGRNDEVVPYQFAEEFGARTPSAHVEVLNSGHELIDVLDYLWEETARFLRIDSPA